jgi:hypothetical protein
MNGWMGVNKGASAAPARRRTVAVLAIIALLLLICTFWIPLEGEGAGAYTGGGYLSPRVSSSVDAIWRASSENEPSNATLTVTVSGTGTKGITLAPQDVVFLMDHSGSLETYDPQVLRILAAHEYVDNMIAPFDRAVVAFFDSDAETVNNHHLSSAYAQIHADLEALARLTPQGQTNYQAGIQKAIDEFDGFGNTENQKIVVFFTDGP